MEHKLVLNIGREFGSGGREIGKLAAQRLGMTQVQVSRREKKILLWLRGQLLA